MSIETKLVTIAENQQRVYDAGYNAGQAAGGGDNKYDEGFEAGRKSEYDLFWDAYQENGERRNYRRLFSQSGWTDVNLKPKYEIICSGSSTNGTYIFEESTRITEIPVDITIIGVSAERCFYNCKNLKTIKKLVINDVTKLTNAFTGCSALENIVVDGVIEVDVNFQPSAVLSTTSAKSIITHLANFAGTANAFVCTLSLNEAVWAALEAEGNTAPGGVTWKDYVTSTLCWNT